MIGEHDLVPTDLGTARIDQNDSSVVFGGNVAINDHGDIAFNAALTPEDNDQIEWGSGMFIAYADSGLAPPPVPDGKSVPGMPLRASRHANGTDVVVTWDVTSCPADDYNLFSGPLGQVDTVAITAAECGLGAGGTAVFTPPTGDSFFVVSSVTASGTSSGQGRDGEDQPRPSSGVGFCGIVEQDDTGSCP